MASQLTYFLFILLSGLFLSTITASKNDHASLLGYIRRHALKDAVPRGDDDKPADIGFGMVLLNVADADPTKKEVEIEAWLMLKWNVGSIWEPIKFNGLESIAVPSSDIWIPDISVFNGINKLSNSAPDLVLVSHEGNALWVPRVSLRALCDVDANKLGWNVSCNYRFGFWTHSDDVLNITKLEDNVVYLEHYFEGSRFEILGTSAVRDTAVYHCCPGNRYSHFDIGISFKEKNPSHVMRGCVQSVMTWH